MKVVVVGAGVVGLACAYELLQDGHDVVVLDGASPGQGASHGNAAKIAVAEAAPVPAPGMVVQGIKWMLRSDSPLYVKPSLSPPFVRFMMQMARNCNEQQYRNGLHLNLRLAEKANEMFDEWQNAGLEFEMHQRGVLIAYESKVGMENRLRYQDIFDSYGATVRLLDETSVHEVEPALSDHIMGGLFYSKDRQIEPDSLTSALVKHIENLGGTMLQDAPVTGFHTGARGVDAVETGGDTAHPCDGVVLAAGVWTAPLAKRLGVTLPVIPGKGYSVDYTTAPVQLRTSLTLDDPHVAITPLNGMLRVAGTMEFSGLGIGVNANRIAAIKRAAARGLRDFDAEGPHREAWAGLRSMTPDGLPVIGGLANGANVWVATGHGMLGLTLAPITGRLIRKLIRGDALEQLGTSPERFKRTKKARTAWRSGASRSALVAAERGNDGCLT